MLSFYCKQILSVWRPPSIHYSTQSYRYLKIKYYLKPPELLIIAKCPFSVSALLKSNMDLPNQMIAVAQMRATADKEDTFSILKNLVEKAVSRGAQMVFLPECCDYIAESRKESIELAEPLNGPTVRKYCYLAKSLKVWLSIGGIHIKEDGVDKISNTHIIIDNLGNIVSKYIKIHLFNVKIPERNIDLQESKYVLQGDAIGSPVLTPCGLVASGICYDMRFPEFSLLQCKSGAHILTFPSAFTVATGLAHWHTLLRARAIETQCYVVAAAQTGQHNSKRSSYGHALIIDPWGTVVAEVSEGNNVAFAEIDLKYLEKIRKEMPVQNHRRKDLYSLSHLPTSSEPRLMELAEFPRDFVSYSFGQVSVRGSHIFLRTATCHAFVNKKPFTSGHSLVTPQKPINRFLELNEGEVSDFCQTIVATLQVLKEAYRPQNVQVAIQDGKWAGQTINHLHAHVVPVAEEESSLLENHESKGERKWRGDEDMIQEATVLRQHTVNIEKSSAWFSTTDMPSTLKFRNPSAAKGMFQIKDLAIPCDRIFLFTRRCFAFLPGNPILPGHACVCPFAEASSLIDLSPGKVADMFLSLQKIQEKIEQYYNTSSTTIFIQNSAERKGLCAHIFPRNENDVKENDDLYKLLAIYDILPPNHSSEEILAYLKESFHSK